MMQRKGFFLLALICGLIAAGSMYIYLNGASRNPPATLKPLVVAKTNIIARTVIGADQLTIKDVPTQGYPLGGYSNIQNVVGAVALVNLTTGDSVLSAMVENPKSGSSNSPIATGSASSLTVPDGKRAVAIPIGLVSGVGYAVRPGDHVDILVTIDIKDVSGNAQTVTTLAAQDVLVLSVGESVGGDKNKIETKSYTLALTVPQAMAVTLGSEKGSLRLLLRNPANTDTRQDPPVNGSLFLDPNYSNRIK